MGMDNMQFFYLFLGVAFNAFALLKIGFDNKIAIAEIKKDVYYIKEALGLCRRGDDEHEND